jgi:hypothetical protein
MRIVFVCFSIWFCLQSQSQTIGLMQYEEGNTDGYILFSGVSSKQTYLIDKCGKKVKEWSSDYKPGLSVELLPNGDLFRTGLSSSSSFGTGGGKGGILEKFDWDGNLLWTYQISDTDQCQHHDAIVLPNGNILAIVWDRITLSEATQSGKDPIVTAILNNEEVWSEKIVELQPVGSNSANIVWEWKAWDHLIQDFDNSKSNYGVVSQHPELIDVNYVLKGPPTNSDWLHINSVDYNPTTDEIILSNHNFGEFWIIDHSTSTSEAASHLGGGSGKGGDLLYRWGNPITYGRGVAGDQKLFKQHHATFIKDGYPNAGKILVFNNGVDRPGGSYSSIDMIDVGEAGYPYNIGTSAAYLPQSNFWTYTASSPATFYAANISGVYPLVNGSFLITDGPNGSIVEIDAEATIKWQYINPVDNIGPMTQGAVPALNTVFRANYYAPEYSAFSDKILIGTTEIELNPTSPSVCISLSSVEVNTSKVFNFYPNPIQGNESINIEHNFQFDFEIKLIDITGKTIFYQDVLSSTKTVVIDFPVLKKGIYFLSFMENSTVLQSDLLIVN